MNKERSVHSIQYTARSRRSAFVNASFPVNRFSTQQDSRDQSTWNKTPIRHIVVIHLFPDPSCSSPVQSSPSNPCMPLPGIIFPPSERNRQYIQWGQ